jgi:hypothetical protein
VLNFVTQTDANIAPTARDYVLEGTCFRSVTAGKFNAREDIGSAEQSLEFGGSQTWVQYRLHVGPAYREPAKLTYL